MLTRLPPNKTAISSKKAQQISLCRRKSRRRQLIYLTLLGSTLQLSQSSTLAAKKKSIILKQSVSIQDKKEQAVEVLRSSMFNLAPITSKLGQYSRLISCLVLWVVFLESYGPH